MLVAPCIQPSMAYIGSLSTRNPWLIPNETTEILLKSHDLNLSRNNSSAFGFTDKSPHNTRIALLSHLAGVSFQR